MKRGLLPVATALVLFAVGEIWLVHRDWKYYLLAAVAAAMFLNGVRVVILAWQRRRQKLATFEHGFAHWRNNVLKIYRWEQVEEVDATPAFFGFTIVCRSDDGRRDRIHFDTSSDPTQDLRGL